MANTGKRWDDSNLYLTWHKAAAQSRKLGTVATADMTILSGQGRGQRAFSTGTKDNDTHILILGV